MLGSGVLQAALYVISPLALCSLYTYMLGQRRKRLGGTHAGERAKSS